MSRVYLDHASDTPLRPSVFDAMLPFLRDHIGDPGRLHHEGLVTRVAIERAREHVASLLRARPREVVFTASGTEAINTAIWGAAQRSTASAGTNIVTTAVEQTAVLEACARTGISLRIVGVDHLGRIDPNEVASAIDNHTALVSVQLANHEVGTMHAIDTLSSATRACGALLHIDACAAVGHVDLDFRALGADLCSITAHTMGGPKGAGALLIRRGLRLDPLIVGGDQERARRAGIEDVAAIVGFGAACAVLCEDDLLHAEATRHRELIARAAQDVSTVDGVTIFGDTEFGNSGSRLPNVLCFGISDVEAEPVLLGLDRRGVAVHSGSACSSEMLAPSPVLEAMGVDAQRSLRISLGWPTTAADIDHFAGAFGETIDDLRALRN